MERTVCACAYMRREDRISGECERVRGETTTSQREDGDGRRKRRRICIEHDIASG